MGARTLLLTQSIETLGQMSCNPAIGGIGKGHLVKEIDALGGVMARGADAAAIQSRTLNASKGPAVRATRVQADRMLYKAFIRRTLENQPNLTLFQQECGDLIVEKNGLERRGARRGHRHRHRISRARGGAHRRHVPRRAASTWGSTTIPAAAPAIRRLTNLPNACARCRFVPRVSRPARHRASTAAPSTTRSWPRSIPTIRARCSATWDGRAIIPRSCPATSRRRRNARTRSFARPPIARPCSPARSKASVRATAQASKTR